MRICFLTNKYPPDPGGLAISSWRLATNLAAAGIEVHLCIPDPGLPPSQIETSLVDRLSVHRLGTQHGAGDSHVDWFELVARLHETSPFDLIQAHYVAGAGFVAVYAGRYLDVPVVVSARGNDLERAVFRPEQSGGILWALSQASAVTAVSKDLARKARALAPGKQVHVIHNGVDGNFFSPGENTERSDPSQAPIIGFVGEARKKKGLTILLPAFKQVTKAVIAAGRPAPELVLIGGIRREDKDILKVFHAQNPHSNVRLFPYMNQDELVAWYRRLDLLVLASLRDGLPNALLEGMACQLAVVASNVGGIRDVVRQGQNGVLVPPGEVAPLALAIQELLLDPTRREAMGRAGRQTVTADFRPEQELAAYLALYESVRNKYPVSPGNEY